MNQLRVGLHKHQGVMIKLFTVALVLFAGDAMAITLGNMASSITGSFKQVTQLVTGGAYVAGMAFAVGAIVQFKAHKDNPTQVPIGKPIALVLIAAALIFLPTILSTTGSTMFGSTPTTAGPTGTVF